MTALKQSTDVRQRSAARLAAVQALYEMEVSGTAADSVLGEFLDEHWIKAHGDDDLLAPDRDLLVKLVRGVSERHRELDEAIDAALTGTWTADRLEILVRAILRAGAFELIAIPEVPTKAAINEYVEVAHAFFPGREPALVNAVLDRLARVFRADERSADTDKGD